MAEENRRMAEEGFEASPEFMLRNEWEQRKD